MKESSAGPLVNSAWAETTAAKGRKTHGQAFTPKGSQGQEPLLYLFAHHLPGPEAGWCSHSMRWHHPNWRAWCRMALALSQPAQGPAGLNTRLSSHHTAKVLSCCTSTEAAQGALALSSPSQHTSIAACSPCFPSTPCLLFLLKLCRGSGTSSQDVLKEEKKSWGQALLRFEPPGALQSLSGSLNTASPGLLASPMLPLHNT